MSKKVSHLYITRKQCTFRDMFNDTDGTTRCVHIEDR